MTTEAVLTTSFSTQLDAVLPNWTARDAALGLFDTSVLLTWRYVGWHRLVTVMTQHLVHAEKCVHRHIYWRNRIRMDDIDAFVLTWRDTLIQMTTGHSHDAFTKGEYSTDDLLKPLLSAPIAQLREFAAKLSTTLEADERVPFLVWSSVKHAVTPLILRRPEGEVVVLKTALAREIAEIVEGDLPRADLIAAIAGALAWRSDEQLDAVKKALLAGNKPRMTGRQSCTFLCVLDAAGKEVANVIL